MDTYNKRILAITFLIIAPAAHFNRPGKRIFVWQHPRTEVPGCYVIQVKNTPIPAWKAGIVDGFVF